MYAEVPALALARAVICLRTARKIVNSDEHRLSEADFVSCGGRVAKRKRPASDDTERTYSLYRQLAYAERSLRKIIKGELPMFDQESKTPGKKQIFDILNGCQDLLKDTNTSTAAWDDSDEEDVNDFDVDSDDEEEDEEDENEGEEADREEEPDDDEPDDDEPDDDEPDDDEPDDDENDPDAEEDGDSDAEDDADSDAEGGDDEEEDEEEDEE